jgi:amino acid permease
MFFNSSLYSYFGFACNAFPIFLTSLLCSYRFLAVINILNTILGTGMLAMPAALSTCGLIMGALVIFLFGSFSALGLYLLIEW